MKYTRVPSSVFLPVIGLRNSHTQSVLNSSAHRGRVVARRSKPLLDAEQEWILDGGDGVRLLGHYSPQPANSRGLVVLLHGWEGSSHSNYIISAGGILFDQGFDVFRLNFRDHGGTHHMNPGVFHSCRLQEVINALKDFQERSGFRDWVISGFSLGGNFALRVARKAPQAGLSIARVVAVCPVISPANVLAAMEAYPRSYEKYYVRKWERSLRLKQAQFPDDYEYETWYGLGGLRERTDFFATRYYEFDSLHNYFEGYSVAGDRLAAISVPTTILTSEDDMVIPISDFEGLPANENIELLVTRHGGHCAFLKNWKMDSFADDIILDRVTNGAG
jgi:predicted alpha/beta-fold hydrolase